MKKVMSWIIKHPRMATLLLIIFVLASVINIGKLEVDSSSEGLMPEKDPARDYYEQIKEKFIDDHLTLVVIKTDNVFTTETLALIDNLTYAFQDIDGVSKVESLTTVNRIKGEGEFLNFNKLVEYIPEDPEELARIKEDALSNEIFTGSLVSADGKVAAINIYTESRPADKDFNRAFSESVDDIIDEYGGTRDIYQLGRPYSKVKFSSFIKRDLKTLTPWSTLVLFLFLLLSFRSSIGVFLPILTAGLSILATLGFMTIIGFPINVITAIVPSLLLVVGSTEDVHMISEYFNGLASGLNKLEAIKHMAAITGLAIFLTALTTFLGFATLASNKITILKQFGISAAFGLMANFIITIVIVPTALRIFGLPRVFKKKKMGEFGALSDKVFRKIAHTNITRRKPIAIAAVIITVLALIGASKLKVNTDFISYFKENTEIRKRSADAHEVLSGVINFFTVIETGEQDKVKDPSVLKHISDLQGYLETLGRFDKSTSLADYIKIMNREMNGGDPSFTTIPDSKDLIAQYLITFERDQIEQYVDFDYSTANIVVRHNISSSWESRKLLKKITEFCDQNFPENLKVNFTGEGILLSDSSDDMVRGQISSLVLALTAIFIIMSVLFVSIKAGLLSLVPNLAPIILNFGLMGWMGIPLSVGTSIVAAIALGIAVDDTIHFMVRYQKELGKTNDQNKAIYATLHKEGRPILFTSIALCMGFLVFLLSNFGPIYYFGLLAAWVMVWALLADLFLTPLLMSWTHLITIWNLVSFKLKKDITEVSPLFADLKHSEAKKVVLLGGLKTFSRGDYVIRQGEEGEDMFMIVSGKVRVTINTESGEKEVAALSEGAVLGEMALVERTVRSANVIAEEETEVLRINEKSLDRIKRRFPRIAAQLFLNLSKVISSRLRKAQA